MSFTRSTRSPIPRASILLLALAALVGLAPQTRAQLTPNTPAWLPPTTTYDTPFFGNVQYDPALKSPDEILGFKLGTRPATHADLEKCLEAWRGSKRMTVHTYAQSHERRNLYYIVITSPANHARLATIRESIGKLADPRKLAADTSARKPAAAEDRKPGTAADPQKPASTAVDAKKPAAANELDPQKLIAETPAIAWMAYNIHGDEMSSTDAAIALTYHLIACTGEAGQSAYTVPVAKILDDLVVVIDPLMNPDGRDRFIRQLNEFAGHTPNLDAQAMQHAGRWPYGRGNHYFFDLNRDWMQGVQPETVGRHKAINEWNPQLLVDSHEMGPYETYLFNPPRAPFNPQLSPLIRKWWASFAGDQAKAFDRFGWSYYTREWLEYWYPGYTDSFGAFRGAIGMLYEQARVGGSPIRQMAGNILTYREAVHHHAISSYTNLETLQTNRVAILTDFLQHNRECCGLDTNSGTGVSARASAHHDSGSALANSGTGVPARDPSPPNSGTGVSARDSANSGVPARTSSTPAVPARDIRNNTFLLIPGPNRSRDRHFLENLQNQGIEIAVAQQPFTANVTDTFRQPHDAQSFPAGACIISMKQPAGRLAAAYLDFDPRMTNEFLVEERRELATKRQSRVYDVTGWSIPMAYDVAAFWTNQPIGSSDQLASVPTRPYKPEPLIPGSVEPADKLYGHVIDGADDAVLRALAHLLQSDVKVRVSAREFRLNGRQFSRGSLLIRNHENQPDVARRVADACNDARVTAYAVQSGLARDDGPDLGGSYFTLLSRPRVALFGNAPVDTVSYGNLWHLLDSELGQPVSLLNMDDGAADLRPYNVVILPAIDGDADAAIGHMRESLKAWVHAGGTLIAISSAVEPLLDEKEGLSAVRLRQSVLPKLEEYEYAVRLERAAGGEIDFETIWDNPEESIPAALDSDAKSATAAKSAAAERSSPSDKSDFPDKSASPNKSASPEKSAAAKSEKSGEDDDKSNEKSDGEKSDSDKSGEKDKSTPAEQLDEYRRIFSPGGVIVRGELDREHWITLGCERLPNTNPTPTASAPAASARAAVESTSSVSASKSILADDNSAISRTCEMPLFFEGPNILMSKHPIETPVRLAPRNKLRLSGLLWPEAAARMADSAYVTVERVGSGQVILFAADPNFRGYYHGSRRLLINAILLGPGCGTSQPTPEP